MRREWPGARVALATRHGGLYVGRLSGPAGIDTLLAAVDFFPGARIDVAGAGPEANRVDAHPSLKLVGACSAEDRRRRMRLRAYLVLPARNYPETPQVLIEAFASGLPVIGSRAGALGELIEPGRNGLLFEPGAARELARRLAWAEAFPEKMRRMGECARADYDARFLPDWSPSRLFGERRRFERIAP